MASLSQILAGVYDYVGRPSQQKLSMGTVLPLLLDAIGFYTVDLQISGENWLVKSFEYSPAAKDDLLAIPDFSVPVAVEMRDAASTDEADWEGILIANISDVQDIGQEGRKAVSFYGTPTRIKWSINPIDLEFDAKIWYEPVAAEPTALTDSPNISQAFHAMLKLRTALMCLPYAGVTNQEEVRSTLLTQLGQWEEKWRQWVNVDRNAKPIQKRDFRGSRRGETWL